MTSTERSEGPAVLVRREGHVGHLILNRPRSINALTHEMVLVLHQALRRWAEDDSVRTVVLTGAGDRGLCAGGDIVAMWHDARAGGSESAAFWADEYRLNALIAGYPKPYVAVLDGIVLGGGIGVSAHGRIRIVTERSSLGMPETRIGFFPDVGGTWLLSRAPGELGTHLGLTAGSMGPADAIELGFADQLVPGDRLPELLTALARGEEEAEEVVVRFAVEPGPSELAAHRHWIDTAYAGNDPLAILERLESPPYADIPEAVEAADALRHRSPTSVALTLRALREAARKAHLAGALAMEFRLAVRCHAEPDFVEGVRAQVIDKDRRPAWSPAELAQVDPAAIRAFFDPLGPGGPDELDPCSAPQGVGGP